jgi:hypothetical protein
MGLTNPMQQRIKDEYWWTKARQKGEKHFYNIYGESTREFQKRWGLVGDVIANSSCIKDNKNKNKRKKIVWQQQEG